MPLVRQGPGLVGTAARAGVAAGVAEGPAPPGAEVGRAGPGGLRRASASGAAAGGRRAPDYTAELEKLAGFATRA